MIRLLSRLLRSPYPRDPRPPPDEDDGLDPRRRETGGPARAEPAAAALLVLAGLACGVFAVLVVVHPQTQAMGLALGIGVLALAGACVLASAMIVPRETAVEPRPRLDDPDEEARTAAVLRDGVEGVSRRRMLLGAAGTAGAGIAAAAVAPLTAIGPGPEGVGTSPWKAGTRLLDPSGSPVLARELDIGSFLTALPSGADPREQGSAVVVVRIDPAEIRLPAGRADWAPLGIMAFSKACTHAGCAVSLFRYPTDEQTSSGPALVCPCHYSTFDVRRGAAVVFGPAGRALPQLPLRIGGAGDLVAGGPMSGPIGPAWWGT